MNLSSIAWGINIIGILLLVGRICFLRAFIKYIVMDYAKRLSKLQVENAEEMYVSYADYADAVIKAERIPKSFSEYKEGIVGIMEEIHKEILIEGD